MIYIYSTSSADVDFYVRNDLGEIVKTITIAGKANIPNKHMLTSRGVSTEVGKDDLAELEKMPLFRQQRDAGFLKVDSKADAEKVAKTMTAKDKSAPAKPEDFNQSALGEVVEVKTQGKK